MKQRAIFFLCKNERLYWFEWNSFALTEYLSMYVKGLFSSVNPLYRKNIYTLMIKLCTLRLSLLTISTYQMTTYWNFLRPTELLTYSPDMIILYIFMFWRYSVRFSAGTPAILTYFWDGFCQSFQANARQVPALRHDSFLPNSFVLIN
jgi:hypothetical protein